MNTDDILPLRQKIGYVIEQERQKQDLTVSDLCKMSETQAVQIGAMETSSTGYTIDAFLKVLCSLGCSLVIINPQLEGSEVIGPDDL